LDTILIIAGLMADSLVQPQSSNGLYGRVPYSSFRLAFCQELSDLYFPARFGNGFAIAVSFLLKIAVGIAYTQYLWRSLRSISISLQTINDAFSVGSNIFSFLNWELLSKIRVGVILAIIFW
jgi:hypothetical protein